MSRWPLSIPLLVAGLLVLSLPAAADDGRPIVVELFTSQGCSSCPPADRLLGELAQRPDVLALSLHVDYWNYIGWSDPFSSPTATARQRDYGRALGLHMVYTPQMVIDGTADVVGSRRGAVEAAIADAMARRQDSLALEFVEDADGNDRIAIPAGASDGPATVWLALYDRQHETSVQRGENAGTTLRNFNVVREWRELGEWRGEAIELPLGNVAASDGCAVIVQAAGTGPILGAAVMPPY